MPPTINPNQLPSLVGKGFVEWNEDSGLETWTYRLEQGKWTATELVFDDELNDWREGETINGREAEHYAKLLNPVLPNGTFAFRQTK
jgi:hypothetical protein